MPIAFNPDTGEALALGPDGQWAPTKLATNPQTGEHLALAGDKWEPIKVDNPSALTQAAKFAGNVAYQAAKGASFGLADEGLAAVQGLTSDKPYDQRLQSWRDMDAKFSGDHPVISTGAQIAGGVGSMLLGGEGLAALKGGTMAARALSPVPQLYRAANVAKTAAAGAGAGAAAGFGDGEGGFENRLVSAGKGAALGGLIGAAAPPLLRGLGSLVTAPFSTSGDLALQKVMASILRDAQKPGMTIEDALAAAQQKVAGMGPTAVLGDVGENTAGLARAVANVPGAGRTLATDVLSTRQAGRGQRILDEARTTMKAPEDYYANIEDLNAARKVSSEPLYEKFRQNTPSLTEPEQALLNRPSMKGAMAKAYRIAAEEGRDPNTIGLGMNEAGDVSFTQQPTMHTLDYVKRGMDDMLEPYRDKTTGRLVLDTEGRAINNTRADFLTALKRDPDYKAAMDAYSGPSQSLDALHMGRRFVNGDPEVTGKILNGLSDGDKDFFRAGALRAVQDMIQTDTAKAAAKFKDSKDLLWQKLRTVFPDDASYNQFRQTVQNELEQGKLDNSALSGSRTAPLSRDIQDLEQAPSPIAQFGADLVTSGPKGALLRALGKGAGWAVDRARMPSENIAAEAGKMLYAQGPQSQQEVLARLLAGPRPKPIYNKNSALAAALLAQQGGEMAGGP